MKKILIIILLLVPIISFGQNSLDDLDVIFQNDFEQNTLGNYEYSEFIFDWYTKWGFTYPGWNTRQSTTDIIQDDDPDDSTKVLKGYYPIDEFGSTNTGFNWWVYLNDGYDELYFSYDLYFMPEFQPQLGGKIPGIMGGYPYSAKPYDGTDYLSASMMFSQSCRIQFYSAYVDAKANPSGALDTYYWGYDGYPEDYWLPSSLVIEYAKGTFAYVTPGEWHNITYRVVLNTVTGSVGDYNGILEGYFDGELYLQISNMQWRHTTDLQIDIIKFYTFFGGDDEDWAVPINEWALFDNVLLYTYKTDSIEVPRDNYLSPTDRTINYWRNFGAEEEPPSTSFDSIKINFIYSTDISQSTENWNNLDTRLLGTTHADLIDCNGDATEIDLYVNSSPIYTTLYGDYPGIYPDSVMRVGWRADGGTEKTIQLKDLSISNTYKFEIFGSYVTGDYTTEYTISDTMKSLNVVENTTNTVSWTFQASSTDLDISWKNTGGSGYGFLNSLVIIDLTEDADEPVNADTLYVADTLFAIQVDSFYLCQLQVINGDTCVGYLDSLNYFIWDTVNFSDVGVNLFIYRYIAYPDYIGEFYMTIDSIDGDTIALWNTVSTGGWYTFGTMKVDLLSTVTGVHDLWIHCNQYAGGDIHWLYFYYNVVEKDFLRSATIQEIWLEGVEQKKLRVR